MDAEQEALYEWSRLPFWLCDHVNEYVDGALLRVRIPACADLEGAGDMQEWGRLLARAQQLFKLPRTLELQLRIELKDGPVGYVVDQVSLEVAKATLLGYGASRLRTLTRVEVEVWRAARVISASPMPPLALGHVAPIANEERAFFARTLKQLVYPHDGLPGKWSDECGRVLARFPGLLFAFDELRELAAAAMGDGEWMLSPIAALCPCCAYDARRRADVGRQGVLLLNTPNQPLKLLQHLRQCHASDPTACLLVSRWERVLADHTCTATELDESVGRVALFSPTALAASKEELALRPDVCLRPPEHRIAWWLNQLLRLQAGALSTKHLAVQQLLALLHALLEVPIADWGKTAPALKRFAQEALYVCRQRGYRLLAGAGMAGTGSKSAVRFDVARKCAVVATAAQSEGSAVGQPTQLRLSVQPWNPWMLKVATEGSTFGVLGDPSRALRLRLSSNPSQPPSAVHTLELTVEAPAAAARTLLERPGKLTLVRERPRDPSAINVGMPPISTVKTWELPPNHDGGTNWPALAALLTVCDALPPAKQVPMIVIPGANCKVVLLSDAYDGRPLTMGAYTHEEGCGRVSVLGARLVDAPLHDANDDGGEGARPCDANWGDLTTDQRAAATLLGFDEESWYDDDWRDIDAVWADLAGEQRTAAEQTLRFTSGNWYGGYGGGLTDEGRPVARPLTAEVCEELKGRGTTACRKAMAGAEYVKEVLETSVCTLDGEMTMNTNTSYLSGTCNHATVRTGLEVRWKELGTCLSCLKAGNRECVKSRGLGWPCDACHDLGCACVYAHSVCSLNDQASEQRKAASELHAEHQASRLDLSSVDFRQCALGALHGNKNSVGATRNYRITDGRTGEFSVSVLRAIVCSDTLEAAQLAAAIKNDVVLCRDRHSDHVAYLTVHSETRAVVAACGHVKVTLVPEPYLKWHPRAENHHELQRPGCMATNLRGEIVVAEPQNHVIMLVSRHVPAKLKLIAGVHGQPGSSNSKLSCPMQLAVVKKGNKEHCFVADSGNGRVMLIRNVQSFDATQMIEPVQIGGGLVQPYGLAVVDSATLVLSDQVSKRVAVVALDPQSLLAGNVVNVLTWGATEGLIAPTCLAVLGERLCIADGMTVWAAPLGNASQRTAQRQLSSTRPALRRLQHQFGDACGLAAMEGGVLVVADRGQHQIVLLTLGGNGFELQRRITTWGVGRPTHLDGPIAAAGFAEPIAVSSVGGVVLVSSYGGKDHGALSTVTRTTFAENLMLNIEGAYDAVGYAPPRASAEQRRKRQQPLRTALRQYDGFVTFLEATWRSKSNALGGIRSAKGPEGCFDINSIEGYRASVESVTAVADALDALGDSLVHGDRVRLYAFLNELRVEHTFGHAIIASTTDNPSMRQYVIRKPTGFRHVINLFCDTLFSNQQSEGGQYQMARQTKAVSADLVMAVAEAVYHAMHPPSPPLLRQEALLAARQLVVCKLLASLASPQRTQAVRDKFKASGYYRPTILFIDEHTDEDGADRFLAVGRALERLHQVQPRSMQVPLILQQVRSSDRSAYIFQPRDLVFVEAGEIGQGVARPPQAAAAAHEMFWAVQVSKPHEKSKVGPRCQVHGYWLDKVGGRGWQLMAAHPIQPYLYFGRLLVDPSTGLPFSIRPDQVPMALRNSAMVYELPSELTDRLEAAVVEQRRQEESGQPDPAESDDDDDEEGGDEEEGGPSQGGGGGEGGGGTTEEETAQARRLRARTAAREARQPLLREVLVGMPGV